MNKDAQFRPSTAGKQHSLFMIFLLCLLVAGAAVSQNGPESYDEVIDIIAGQTDILTYRGVRRVSIGDDALLDVKVLQDAGQILLIGKNPGVTDLRVWLRDGRQTSFVVQVMKQAPAKALAQVEANLLGIEGVRARLAGDQVVIEGRSLREEDFERIQAVAEQYGASNFVVPGGITMRGMVLLDVKVVEVRKSSLKDIGINWADAAAGPTGALLSDYNTNSLYRGTGPPAGSISGPLPLDAGTGNAFFGISTSITSVLDLLVRNGDARTLAEPKLTCVSGEQAEFLAGGEVPIPITNENGALNVQFKQFGIILNMAPVADPSGFIATHVEVEVSNIDPTVVVLGIPGFVTRRTITSMNVKEGQTMVISGLLNSERSKDVDKFPLLGSIPVLGELFKSREFRNNETELIVLVTPSLVDPDHKINKELVQRSEDLIKQSDEDLRFKLMD